MAAYAAVVSLMNTIDNIQNHPIHSFCLDKNQIQSLHNILDFLLDFIESYNCRRGSREDEVLESRIACAAHAAEDAIESHVVDQIHAGSTADHGETSSGSLLDLEAVIKDMNSVKETVMEFQETEEYRELQSPSSSAPSTSSNAKDVMVGFDDELIHIMDRLTGPQPDLLIVPIVGMGGIGKTTLANNVFENSYIVERFDIRAWATISQGYSVVDILSEINKSLEGFGCEMDQENVDQLGLNLYQGLWGRRYLIVLDDIWSVDVWDKIRSFFPNNDCKSRVVITTRITNVASHLSTSSFEMNFLDENKSWKLFCEKTFPKEGCPPELKKIGKEIARNCKGLPLSISVIGGLLRNSRTREYWESVARDTNSILLLEKDEHCLNILSLSYNRLPAHLKPCFLYIGLFPGNFKVFTSALIKLFVAEGLLKPNNSQSLEDIADDYLNGLFDRNLILVKSRKWKGTIKQLRMHDLVKEVCLRIAEKEKFFYKIRVIENQPDISRECRIALNHRTPMENDGPQVVDTLPTTSVTRTIILGNSDTVALPFKCRLLRVLFYADFESMEAISELVNMRYVAYKPPLNFHPLQLPSKLPSSVSLLWNLQTLIIYGGVEAPVEIWYMRQLRRLHATALFLPDPPPSDQQDDLLLPNLRILSRVMNFSFAEEVCKRIPNITKLRINYDNFSRECQQNSYYYLDNLVNLLKLESLQCSFYRKPKRDYLLQSLMFPSSLRKLSLRFCHLHWEDLDTYGFSMPNLQVLKLEMDSVVGPKWDCVEGAFPSLRFLKICDANLRKWTAQDSDFPKLEKLHLQNLKKLEKIPSGLGDVQTLRFLHLYECSESANISATEILDEQRSLGNDNLQVQVVSEERRKYLDQVRKFFSWNNILSKLNFGLRKFTTR